MTSFLSMLVLVVIALLVISLVIEALPAVLKLAIIGFVILVLLHVGRRFF